jgi:hypothetical protein
LYSNIDASAGSLEKLERRLRKTEIEAWLASEKDKINAETTRKPEMKKPRIHADSFRLDEYTEGVLMLSPEACLDGSDNGCCSRFFRLYQVKLIADQSWQRVSGESRAFRGKGTSTSDSN